MNLTCPRLVRCPTCGYEIYSKAKKVTRCKKCDKSFRIKNVAKTTNNVANASISDDILKGNILETLEIINYNNL